MYLFWVITASLYAALIARLWGNAWTKWRCDWPAIRAKLRGQTWIR